MKPEGAQSFDEKDLMDVIWDMVYILFGEFGASQTALSKIKWDSEKEILTIRCSHRTLPMVRASTATVTQIKGKPAALRVIAVSGTLKALRTKLSKQ